MRAPESPGRDCPRWVNSPSLWPRAAPSGGARPASLGIRTPHRSGDDVSLLFQSRRSPAPGLRPVTCPTGGGTFLMACATGAGLPLPHTDTPVPRIRLTNDLFSPGHRARRWRALNPGEKTSMKKARIAPRFARNRSLRSRYARKRQRLVLCLQACLPFPGSRDRARSRPKQRREVIETRTTARFGENRTESAQ